MWIIIKTVPHSGVRPRSGVFFKVCPARLSRVPHFHREAPPARCAMARRSAAPNRCRRTSPDAPGTQGTHGPHARTLSRLAECQAPIAAYRVNLSGNARKAKKWACGGPRWPAAGPNRCQRSVPMRPERRVRVRHTHGPHRVRMGLSGRLSCKVRYSRKWDGFDPSRPSLLPIGVSAPVPMRPGRRVRVGPTHGPSVASPSARRLSDQSFWQRQKDQIDDNLPETVACNWGC